MADLQASDSARVKQNLTSQPCYPQPTKELHSWYKGLERKWVPVSSATHLIMSRPISCRLSHKCLTHWFSTLWLPELSYCEWDDQLAQLRGWQHSWAVRAAARRGAPPALQKQSQTCRIGLTDHWAECSHSGLGMFRSTPCAAAKGSHPHAGSALGWTCPETHPTWKKGMP